MKPGNLLTARHTSLPRPAPGDLPHLRLALLEECLRRRMAGLSSIKPADTDPAAVLHLDVQSEARAAVERWAVQQPRDYAAAVRGSLRAELEAAAAQVDWAHKLGGGRLVGRLATEAQRAYAAGVRPLLGLLGHLEQVRLGVWDVLLAMVVHWVAEWYHTFRMQHTPAQLSVSRPTRVFRGQQTSARCSF